MSETDSFIEEVTEEVRRDRLFAMMRRYGWIAVLVVILLVGGTAYREYRQAQDRAQAQAFGDAILDALELEEEAGRIDALAAIDTPNASADAVLGLLMAAQQGSEGDDAEAVERLQAVITNQDVPKIYRDIASYKALSRADAGMDAQTRRAGLEGLAVGGNPMRLLAEEQLALLDIEAGDTDSAGKRLLAIVEDAEVTAGLQRRALQLITALGVDLSAESDS